MLCAGPAGARESNRSDPVRMRPLSGEELLVPHLEEDDVTGLLTAAQVDTYCIVWYDFEEMDWQGWTRVDNTAQRDTFFHVDDFAGLGGGTHGGLVPLEGTKSVWCGLRDWDHQIPGCPGDFAYVCSGGSAPGYGNDWDKSFKSDPVTFISPLVISYRIRVDTEPGHDEVSFGYIDVYDDRPEEHRDIAFYSGRIDTVVTHTLYLAMACTKLRFRFI